MKTRKTAGTSIEMLLEPLCTPTSHEVTERTETIISKYGIVGSRLVGKYPDEPLDKHAWREHLQMRFVRDNIGRWKWARYFKFTAVRNPFDRAVSFFYWRHDYEGWPVPEDFAGKKAAFRNFILSGQMKQDRGVVGSQGKYHMQDAIRYERLHEDIRRICNKLKLPIEPGDLPKTKTKTSRPKDRQVSDHFDRETTQAVREQMAWVFDNYNYSPDPMDCNAVVTAGTVL